MTKEQWLKLMRFPSEWADWGMYPDELFELQYRHYQPGHEEGAEHDRNGAFHWWLRRQISQDELVKLLRLTYMDSDQLMAQHVRTYIRQHAACDAVVLAHWRDEQ